MTQTIPSPETSAIAQAERQAANEPVQQAQVAARARSLRAYDPFENLSYNPEGINAYYQRRLPSVIVRIVTVIGPMLFFALQVWWNGRGGTSEKVQRRQAQRLRELLTDLGPAYIKIGQALSTRPDLVPPLYLDELTRLQDQLPPFPNELAFRYIEEELGQPPAELYDDLSPNPVAAASLGQVYKGKLKTGEPVAVKVQRPGLAQRITLDIYILRKLAQWATNNVTRIRSDLVAIMDEFGARIFEEMDYTHEGDNAIRFAQLYGHLKDIYVPKIYTEYTARRVLTMEWIDGTKLTNLVALNAQGIDATHLIDVGVQCSLRQLLEHGFFHADPHPGNLLAMRDGKLAYLDFGMMSEVKPYQRYGLIEAVVHMVNRDFEGLAGDYVKLEFLTPETDLSPIIPALAEVFNNALGASVAELNFKSITDEFSALMYEYPFRVPAYYALIIRSLVTLEGIAINVDPNFKVLSKAYPYVAKRLLTDPAPELRSSLSDLLFRDGEFRWNRLENLLRNAGDSDEYDMEKVLDQTIDFLFSERGAFIRDRIADEVAKELDNLGSSMVQTVQQKVRQRLGWEPQSADQATLTIAANSDDSNLDRILRIAEILRETKGFDATLLARQLPQVLTKRETRDMGQRIVGNLTQRAAARFIRDVLLANTPVKPIEVAPAAYTR